MVSKRLLWGIAAFYVVVAVVVTLLVMADPHHSAHLLLR